MDNLKQSIGESGNRMGLDSDSESLCGAEVGRRCGEDVSVDALMSGSDGHRAVCTAGFLLERSRNRKGGST